MDKEDDEVSLFCTTLKERQPTVQFLLDRIEQAWFSLDAMNPASAWRSQKTGVKFAGRG